MKSYIKSMRNNLQIENIQFRSVKREKLMQNQILKNLYTVTHFILKPRNVEIH